MHSLSDGVLNVRALAVHVAEARESLGCLRAKPLAMASILSMLAGLRFLGRSLVGLASGIVIRKPLPLGGFVVRSWSVASDTLGLASLWIADVGHVGCIGRATLCHLDRDAESRH